MISMILFSQKMFACVKNWGNKIRATTQHPAAIVLSLTVHMFLKNNEYVGINYLQGIL